MGRELNLATNVFGVQMSKKSSNQSSEIDFVKMIMLQFHAELPKPYTKQHAADYEMNIVHYFYKFVSNECLLSHTNNNCSNYKNDHIRVLVLSTAYISNELVRAGHQSLPPLAIGFLIMSVFSVITACINAVYMRQMSIDKIYLGLMTGICPLLACSTALGLLFWLGLRFSSILCATPFLIMAIGL